MLFGDHRLSQGNLQSFGSLFNLGGDIQARQVPGEVAQVDVRRRYLVSEDVSEGLSIGARTGDVILVLVLQCQRQVIDSIHQRLNCFQVNGSQGYSILQLLRKLLGAGSTQ